LWKDEALRLTFLVIMGINFLLLGPILVGIPVLADRWLPEGALAYGLLMSGFAGGSLAGYLLAGSIPRPNGTTLRLLLLGDLMAFALVIGSFAFIRSTWLDFSLMLLLGFGNGYLSIIMFTWIQLHTPRAMLGRMMSIMIFFSQGLLPVSEAISGLVLKWNFHALFIIAGALSLLVTLWAAFQPGLKTFSENLAANQVNLSG
jgi:MFS family permease